MIVGGAVDVEDIDRFGRCAVAGFQERHARQTGDAGDEIRGLASHPIGHKAPVRMADQITRFRSTAKRLAISSMKPPQIAGIIDAGVPEIATASVAFQNWLPHRSIVPSG